MRHLTLTLAAASALMVAVPAATFIAHTFAQVAALFPTPR